MQSLSYHACSMKIGHTSHGSGSSTTHTKAALGLHHLGRHAHPQYAVCFHALQNLWQACDGARAVQVSHMREENDTLMDALVRAKIEAAESQGMLAHSAMHSGNRCRCVAGTQPASLAWAALVPGSMTMCPPLVGWGARMRSGVPRAHLGGFKAGGRVVPRP